jgi:hypothetical protein
MIVEWFLDALVSLLEAAIGALPTFNPPTWFTNSGSMVGQLFGFANSMGAWMPIGLLMTVATAVLTCVVIGFGIKLTRIAASFLTAGGGSAG